MQAPNDKLEAPLPASWMDLHALFGVLSWIYVVACFQRCMHQRLPRQPADIHGLSRRLSRQVYLLLYVLLFCAQTVAVLSGAPGHILSDAADSFRGYLAYGLFTIATVHVLAAVSRHIISNDLVPALDSI